MAFLAQAVPYVLAAGSLLNAGGKISSGQDRQRAKEFEAQQAEIAGGQAQASAQRSALDESRKARLVASRALAVASASGAGASDPTVQKIIADIAGEGQYRADVARYQGEDQARSYRMRAAGSRYEGAQAQRAGETEAVSSLMSGVGQAATLFGRFGGGGPAGLFASGSAAPVADAAYSAGAAGWIDAGSEAALLFMA